MILTLQKYRSTILLLLGLCALYVFGVLATFSVDPANREFLAGVALPFDLMIFIPGVFYFFIVRRHKLTPLLVVPVIWIGSLVVTQVVQPNDLRFVLALMGITLAIEIAIAVYEARRIARCYKLAKASSANPRVWFEETFFMLTKSQGVSKLAAAELVTMWYALLSWKKKLTAEEEASAFTYHKKSGYASFVWVMLGVSVIEIVAVHLLLTQVNAILALIVVVLSIYTMLWLLGDLRASALRPVKIGKEFLEVNAGLRVSAQVPLEMIESIDTKEPSFDKKEVLNLGIMDECNSWIILKEAVEIEGLLGIKKSRRAIGLTIDDAARFRSTLKEALSHQKGEALLDAPEDY